MLKLLKLHFTTPLHISTVREDYAKSNRRIHSDTLYSAIIQAWAWLGMDTEIPQNEQDTIPFALSSLFPFTNDGEGKAVYFLPRPFKSFHWTDEVGRSFNGKMKLLKEIEWFDVACFKEHLQNPKGYTPALQEVQGSYLTKKLIEKDFLVSQVVPRVTVPRNGGDAEPYYIEKLQFKEKVYEKKHTGGFYCLFEGDEASYLKVRTALELLGEQGLGTDRNVGNGKFELMTTEESEVDVFAELFTTQSNYYTNLSLFNPTSHTELIEMIGKDEPHENIGFEMLKRGGWITTEPYLNLRKKVVFMFQEGSVFKHQEPLKMAGATINLRPEIMSKNSHPIWRVGKSIFVPITFA